VIRRKGNRWEVSVYAGIDPLTGKERRRPSRTTAPDATREEAEELYVMLRKEVRAGQHENPGRAGTFAQLLDEWFAIASVSTGEDGDWSPKTALEHRRIIRAYLRDSALGRKQVRRITSLDIDRFYAALVAGGGRGGRPLAKATVKRIRVVVVAALDQAVSWDMVQENVARDARFFKAKGNRKTVRKRKVIPPVPAVQQLLVYIIEHDWAMALFVRLIAATGSRRGSVCALRWSDLDLETGELVIERSIAHGIDGVVEKGTKTDDSNVVLLDAGTVEDLRAHRARQAEQGLALGIALPPDGYLFSLRQRGRLRCKSCKVTGPTEFHHPWHPEVVTHRFSQLRSDAGLADVPGLTMQKLRSYVISHLLDQGVPLAVVSRQVQHARQSTTTDHYNAPVDARDQRVPDVLGALLPEPASRRRRSS
jgi:integrase